jgi:hypothetical protein
MLMSATIVVILDVVCEHPYTHSNGIYIMGLVWVFEIEVSFIHSCFIWYQGKSH